MESLAHDFFQLALKLVAMDVSGTNCDRLVPSLAGLQKWEYAKVTLIRVLILGHFICH
jgi:hypothetical protein